MTEMTTKEDLLWTEIKRLRRHSEALARLVKAHDRTAEMVHEDRPVLRESAFAEEGAAWEAARELLKESGA